MDIREARSGVERELLKYALKTVKVNADRIVEYALAMHRARSVSTGGAWYGCVRDEELVAEQEHADTAVQADTLTFLELLRMVEARVEWAISVLHAVSRWISTLDRPHRTLGRRYNPS